jgi:hypothetical protein
MVSRITWAKSSGGIASSVFRYAGSSWARSGVNGAKRSSGSKASTTALIPWAIAISALLNSFIAREASQITPPAMVNGTMARTRSGGAHCTAQGNDRTKGVTTQRRPLDAQDIHQPQDVLAHQSHVCTIMGLCD